MIWDQMQTGRFALLGNRQEGFIDNGYFNILYSDGFLVFGAVLFAYYCTAKYACLRQQYYLLVFMGLMMVYGYMEQFPFNGAWNPIWMYTGVCFYDWKWFRQKGTCSRMNSGIGMLVGGTEIYNENFDCS